MEGIEGTYKQNLFVSLCKKIIQLFEASLTPHKVQRCLLGSISKNLTEAILIHTNHSVRGFKFHIDKYTIVHVTRKHKFCIDHFLLLPHILHAPDKIKKSFSTKQGLASIIFEKTVDKHDYVCIIEIRNGARILAIKTFYEKRKTPC